MPDVTVDDRGRLTLPEDIRERYGERYHLVQLENGLKLIPIAEEPLEALRDEFSGLDESTDELRKEARDAALEEAGR